MIESGFSVLYFVPLFLIIILANLADKQRLDGSSGKAAVRLSYGIHIVFFGAIALFGVLLHVLGFRMWTDDDLTQRILNMLAGDQAEQLEVFLPILVRLKFVGTALWAPAVTAMLCLLPAARRQLINLIPIDISSSVHAVAISFVMLTVTSLALSHVGGPEAQSNLPEATESDVTTFVTSTLIQRLTIALWTLFGVGWLTRRKWRQVIERLALVMPCPTDFAIGIGTGLLWICFILVWESILAATGWGQTEAAGQIGEAELQQFFESIPAILALGLAIGIGEESLFRGALQPRFGLLLTSLLFAVVGSQSGITFSTPAIFIVGLTLGMLRERFNTTTCAIAHCTYNITFGLTEHLYPQVF